jgi:RNA polymerase sigma-70 factor (ECF subfamily)
LLIGSGEKPSGIRIVLWGAFLIEGFRLVRIFSLPTAGRAVPAADDSCHGLRPLQDEDTHMVVMQQRSTLVLDLFDQYYERVYAFLRKSTVPDVAEDLAQEVFLRLMQHPELERLEISISYLLKIAHNLLRRRFSRASRLRELLEERVRRDGDPEIGPVKRHQSDESVSDGILETALGLLTRDEQDAIKLIVCEGKSYQHAAEALGVSVTTINNWKHRGITKLRRYIEDAGEGTTLPEAHDEPSSSRRLPRRGLRVETTSDFASDSAFPSASGRLRAAQQWRARADDVA